MAENTADTPDTPVDSVVEAATAKAEEAVKEAPAKVSAAKKTAAKKTTTARKTAAKKVTEATETATAKVGDAAAEAKQSAKIGPEDDKSFLASLKDFELPKFELPKLELPHIELPKNADEVRADVTGFFEDVQEAVSAAPGKVNEFLVDLRKQAEDTVAKVRELISR